MAKLTQSQLTALLSKLLSQDVELVENETESDYDESNYLSAVDKTRTPIIKAVLSKELHGQALRTANEAYRKSVAKMFNVPMADIAELESDELLSKAMEAYKSTLPDAGKDAQKRIDEILATHAKEKETLTSEWERKYSEKEAQLTRKSKVEALRKYHKDASGLSEKANRDKLAEVFLSHLEGNAVVKLNEAGDDIELFDPKDPSMPLLNQALNTRLGVPDFMKPYYLDLGLWNEDTRDVSATAAAKTAATQLGKQGTVTQTTAQPMGNASASYQEFAQNFQ